MPDESQWDPQSALIHREVTREKFAILLRHPQYPCSTKVNVKAAGDLESGIKRVAAKYLQKVAKDGKWNIELFPSPHNPPQANDFEFAENVPLVWMPLSRSPNDLEDSILILRKDPAGKLIDRSVTLFAAYTASKTARKKLDSVIGSALGARIQLTIRGPETGENHVRITGAMFSAGLPTILNSQSPLVRILGARIKEGNNIGILTLSKTIGILIANALGLKPDAVIVNGFQPVSAEPNEDLVNVFAHVPRESNARPELGDGLPARNISATVRLRPKRGKNKGIDEVLSFAIAPIVAHAVGNRTAKLFSPATAYRTDLLDPASHAGYGKREGVRPNRARAAFEPYRHAVELPDLSAPGSLDLTGKDGWFHVAQSRFAGSSANESLPHQCDPDHVPHARCNDFAAVSAYRQTSEFFQKMDGFGLARADFFRFTPEPKAKNPPLIVRYRAGLAFGAGRDGRTVNGPARRNSSKSFPRFRNGC